MDYSDKPNEITEVFIKQRQQDQSLKEIGDECYAVGFKDGERAMS